MDCTFGGSSGQKADAAFGLGHQPGTLSIIRSMESAQYYPENDLAQARRWVSTIFNSVIFLFRTFVLVESMVSLCMCLLVLRQERL